MQPPKFITYGLVGSRGYGVAFPDSDHDYMGVVIEPEETIFGLQDFEHTEIINAEGQIKVYGLKKFLRMLLKGSPTALELLFVKPEQRTDPYTNTLMGMRPDIVSKKHLKAYAAYMNGQIKKLQTGRGSRGEQRPKLVSAYGYDTKFAYHILRIGIMGQVLGQTGQLSIPMDDLHRAILMEVRTGEWPEAKVLQSAVTMAEGIEHFIQHSHIPDEPNRLKLEDWLKWVYRYEYGPNSKRAAL